MVEILHKPGFLGTNANFAADMTLVVAPVSSEQAVNLGIAKIRNKKQHGTARHHLDSYMIEFLWRSGTEIPYNAILLDIANAFPSKI